MTTTWKITPDMQAAIDQIAADNGCGAATKEALKADNMTWFAGVDLMDAFGWSMQKAGGVMLALDKAGLAVQSDTSKPRIVNGEREGGYNWTLTDRGIDATTTLK